MSYRDDSLIYGRENIFRDYDGITPKIDANGSPVISGWHTENNSNGYVSDWIMRIVYDSTFDEPVIEIYACDSGQLVCCHPITTFILCGSSTIRFDTKVPELTIDETDYEPMYEWMEMNY